VGAARARFRARRRFAVVDGPDPPGTARLPRPALGAYAGRHVSARRIVGLGVLVIGWSAAPSSQGAVRRLVHEQSPGLGEPGGRSRAIAEKSADGFGAAVHPHADSLASAGALDRELVK
jgi:hypothetical protein